MVYANDGFEPENDQFSFGPAVIAGGAVQRTQSANQHRSVYRNPSGSQYRPPPPRRISEGGLSEISEAVPVPSRQRLGDEMGAAGLYDIPRAKMAEPREPRRIIRTPSGRQMTAQDYLIKEYKDKQHQPKMVGGKRPSSSSTSVAAARGGEHNRYGGELLLRQQQ